MKLRRTLALLLAVVMAFAFFGCNPGTTTTTGSSEGTTDAGTTGSQATTGPVAINGVLPGSHDEDWRDYELAEDQVLNMQLTWTSTTTLDPNDSTGSSQWTVMQAVNEGLFRVYGEPDSTQTLEPAACERYEVSPDGLTYTFYLRENYWSDGVQVTANDFVYSFKRLLDPEQAFGYASYAFPIKNAEAYYNGQASYDDIGVRAVDDLTFEVTLERPTAYFIEMMGMVPYYPIRQDIVEAAPDQETWQTDYTYHVFSGPFIIKEHIKENKFVLAPNEYYWDKENVKLTEVNLIVVGEMSTRALMFENGQFSAVEGSAEFIDRWSKEAENGTYVKLQLGRPMTGFLTFNQYAREDAAELGRPLGGKSGLMLNEKCRLAISLSVDREALINTVYNRYSIAGGYVPPGMHVAEQSKTFRDQVADDYIAELQAQYDTKEKRAALFEEGMAEEGVSGTVADVTLKMISSATTSIAKQALEFYQQNIYENLGVTIDLNILDSSLYQSVRDSGDWDMGFTSGWIGDYDDPLTMLFLWTSDSGYYKSFGGFNDEEFDSLMAQAELSTDPDERLDLFAQAEEILVTKAGCAPLYYGDQIWFYHPNVHNLNLPQLNPIEFSRVFISAD